MDVYKRFMTDPGPLVASSPVDPALSPEEQSKVRLRMLFAHQQKYKEVCSANCAIALLPCLSRWTGWLAMAQMLGVVDDRIVFAAINFRSSSSTEIPNGRSHPLFNLLTDMHAGLAARAPPEIGSFYFTDLLSTVGGFTWFLALLFPSRSDRSLPYHYG